MIIPGYNESLRPVRELRQDGLQRKDPFPAAPALPVPGLLAAGWFWFRTLCHLCPLGIMAESSSPRTKDI